MHILYISNMSTSFIGKEKNNPLSMTGTKIFKSPTTK